MARPSSYTPELAEIIFQRLEAGEPLAKICRDDDMPGVRTVLDWADKDEVFAQGYTQARNAHGEQIDAQIQEAIESAHDKDSAAAARAKISGLIWRASKQAPKRYGDKLEVDLNHKADLPTMIDRGRQRVIEGNKRLGLPNGDSE